ncbi:zona pellucida sperm-binding protein 3-like [Embiotoca jacksoni]|uniref:zona pellucida sperm-binding protein 3-like n=1 Tax=Embiotoca jacksoni TaxID=100190 RepID=UPI0037045FC2
MGFREAVLLGCVLLLSTFGSATQNLFNSSTNETLDRIPHEKVSTSLQLPSSSQTTDHQSNQMEQREPVRSPVSYRLKSLQLRNPAVGSDQRKPLQPGAEQMQTPQRSEARELTSEQLEQRKTVQAQGMLKVLVQGPDLNRPVKQESKVLVKFEPRMPEPADSVAVRCGEKKVTVEIKQNFLGNGQIIRPSDLTLGGCTAVDTAENILQFQSELQSCGSTKTMTKEAFIYTFSLIYSPTPISNTFILKTNPAEVLIQCHYKRRHSVSSSAMTPTWNPFASDMQAAQQLHFSLRLMTEDWQSRRPSSVYFLSDVMHIEASILQGHHVPLRMYADTCVATVSLDPNSQPRYPFIDNHGCLTDAKLTGAKSYFMPWTREDKLHFQLKAFRFHQDDSNSLYITCHLKATTVSVPIDSQHKACSYLTEAKRWVASGGDNKVCSCCESSCGEQRQKRSLAADAALQWEGTASLGPIMLQESILQKELIEQSEPPPEPAHLVQTRERNQNVLYSSIALLCGAGAALAVVVLFFTAAVMCSKLRKSTGHSVST